MIVPRRLADCLRRGSPAASARGDLEAVPTSLAVLASVAILIFAAPVSLSGQGGGARAADTVTALIERSDSLLEAGDAAAARRVAEEALQRHTADPAAAPGRTATLHFRLADIHWALGDADAAVRSLEAGLAIRRDADRLVYLANILARDPSGDERTVALYREAIDSVEAANYYGDQRVLPRYLTPLGNFLAARGRYPEAMRVLERAVSIHASAYGEESEEAAVARFHLATALHRAGRLDEAAELYEAVREPLFAHPAGGYGASPWVRRYRAVLAWTADLHEARGNLQDALDARRSVLEYLEADPEAGPADRQGHLVRLIGLNVALGQYQAADLLAARLLRELPDDAGPLARAQAVALYARALRYARRYEDAQLLLETALAEAVDPEARRYLEAQRAFLDLVRGDEAGAERRLRELAAGAPDAQRAVLHSALRRLYIEQGRWREARALHTEPPDPRGHGADREVAAAWIDHGLLLEHEGDLSAAESALTAAIEMLTPRWLAYERFPEDARALYSPTTSAHPEERTTALVARARVRRLRGKLDDALADARAAADQLDMLVRMQDFDEMREARLRAEHGSVVDERVAVHVARGEPWSAIHAADRARGSMLVQRMYGGGLMARIEWSSVEEELGAELRETLAESGAAVSRLQADLREAEADGATPARIAALRDSLRTADRSLERLRREVVGLVAGSSMDYGATWEDSIPVAALTREMETEAEPVILYHLGDTGSRAFLIQGAADPAVFPLTVSEDDAAVLGIEPGPLTRDVAAGLMTGSGAVLPSEATADRSGERGARRDGFTPARALALRRAVVPDPLLERIADSDRAVVVPDGALHLLPFALLVVVNDGEAPVYLPDRGPRLRYVSSLQYAYTLALFEDAVSAWGGAEPSLLSVSAPDFRVGEGAAAERDGPVPVDRGEWLQPLPGTAAEADSLAGIFGTVMPNGSITRLSGADATEARVRAALPGHAYLHFATHGLVDERRSALFASLAFTPGPAPTPEDDGLLQLHEIYELRLGDVDLAVLSACDTNRGELSGGEGVFALSRGFLGAGAKRVLATQWPVDDAATAAFVAAFFRSVAEQRAVSGEADFTRAVRDAQQAVRHHPEHPEWSDPYYWAPFVLIGKG